MGRGILCPFALYKSYKAFILDFGKLYEWILSRYENGKLRGKKLEEVGQEEGIFVPVYSSGISPEIREKVKQASGE